jgi:hypothetical protein
MPLSELTVANLFIEQYHCVFFRIDDEQDDSCLFVAPRLTHDNGEELPQPLPGEYLPHDYVFHMVCTFIAELTANRDEVTQLRCGRYAFISSVMEFIRRDPRLRSEKQYPRGDEYDHRRCDKLMEGRRANRQRAFA